MFFPGTKQVFTWRQNSTISALLVIAGYLMLSNHDVKTGMENCVRKRTCNFYFSLLYFCRFSLSWQIKPTHKCMNTKNLTCPGRCSTGAVWTQWWAGHPARSGPGRKSRHRSSAGGPARWHQTASPTPTPAGRRKPETRWSSWSWFSWWRTHGRKDLIIWRQNNKTQQLSNIS